MSTNLQEQLANVSKDTDEFLESLHTELPKFYFKDWAVSVMLDQEFPVIEATTRWLEAYEGDIDFVRDVKRRVKGGKILTARQARALLNIAWKMRKDGQEWSAASIGTSEGPMHGPTEAPKPHLHCFKCREAFFNWDDLNAHKEQAHPQVFTCRIGGCDHSTTDADEARAHRRVHYAPLFENVPQSGLDLETIPDGRYACPNLDPNEKDYIFLTVRHVPRDHTRSKKYRYGWVSYGTERVAAGTVEVRRWHGDAKELIGEQRPGETYRGDHLKEFEMILADPTASSRLFGKLNSCCGRCGRTLTDPESRKHGIGPECIKHFVNRPGTSVSSTETKESLTEKVRNAIGRKSSTTPTWAMPST